MSLILHRELETDIEKKILTGMIVSKSFLRDIRRAYKPVYFRIPFGKTVAKWAISYYADYEDAPKASIQDIYNLESPKMKREEAELVGIFLSDLSESFETDGSFNDRLWLDKAYDYFGKRSLEILQDDVSKLTEAGKTEEANKTLENYRAVAKTVSRWSNPFSEDVIKRVFENYIWAKQDPDTSGGGLFILNMPGRLGEVLGPLARGWLGSIVGPTKRGKTWWLMEFAVAAALQGKKVAFISLEMSEEEVMERLFKRLTGMADEEDPAMLFPMFDCSRNQRGECTRAERRNQVVLLNAQGGYPDFIDAYGRGYKPCVFCKEKRIRGYEVATWFQALKVQQMGIDSVRKKMKAIKRMVGENIRIISYPAYEGKLSDIEHDLDHLAYTDDFYADVVGHDYLDITDSETKADYRHQINTLWMRSKGIARKRNLLYLTGSQTNRDADKKKSVGTTDIGEDYRKNQHIDFSVFLNQTDIEADMGVMRLGFLHRHKKISKKEQIHVLQALATGMPYMGGY